MLLILTMGAGGGVPGRQPESIIVVRDPSSDPFCLALKASAKSRWSLRPGVAYGRVVDESGSGVRALVELCAGDENGETGCETSVETDQGGNFIVGLHPGTNGLSVNKGGFVGASVVLGTGEFCFEVRLRHWVASDGGAPVDDSRKRRG
jgi:hypothetical protein